MRRHAHDIPRSERALLTTYWALSGYGLRASRALGWLLGGMATTVLLMMLWGLPKDDPRPQSTGTLTGRRLTLTTIGAEPVNPDGPYRERLSAKRFEKSSTTPRWLPGSLNPPSSVWPSSPCVAG